MTAFFSTDKPAREEKKRVSTKEWKTAWIKCLKGEVKKYENGNNEEEEKSTSSNH